jgi:hypothetical protein
MGCDIHFYREIRIKGEKNWNLFEEIEVNRDYEVFGLLAGVRNNFIEPISEPKGLPESCSKYLKNIFNNGDFHTPSFLDESEVKFLKLLLIENNKGRLLKKLSWIRPGAVEEYRFVFWFDS